MGKKTEGVRPGCSTNNWSTIWEARIQFQWSPLDYHNEPYFSRVNRNALSWLPTSR